MIKKIKSVIKTGITFPLRKLLPKKAYNNLKHRYVFWHYPYKSILQKNVILENAGKGKRAFLLATGPSINLENLTVLQGEDCYTVSNFFLHKHINTIQPQAHFFAAYHKPLTIESYIEWFNLADKMLPSNTKIILNIRDHQLVKKHNFFKDREIFYLHSTGEAHSKVPLDLTRPIIAPQTIPLMVLPVLFYMGYEKIYLLGCDHTTMRDHQRNFCRATNFYNPNQDVRRFEKYDTQNLNIIDVLTCIKNVFEQYQLYKNASQEYDQSQIINLSQDTWLDLFPMQKLTDVVGKKNAM